MAAAGIAEGWCAPEVREAFPDLRLVLAETRPAPAGWLSGTSPAGVRERLRALSDRWSGAQAVMVRRQPVPAAYRVFFRHIGLDPDVQRTPLENAVLERLIDGGFRSQGLLHDVLLLALVDTSVPVWALDADLLDGPLGLRLSTAGEPLGQGDFAGAPDRGARDPSRRDSGARDSGGGDSGGWDPHQTGGQLVVADASAAVAVLFGEPLATHRATLQTRRVALFALQVQGVPAMHVEEALWSAHTRLEWAAREL